ncbi:MAG: integrin alpha [Myxococcota bacterium]
MLLSLTGCPSPCSGADCAEDFSASLARVHLNFNDFDRPPQTPERAQMTFRGTTELGPDWSMRITDGWAFVGSDAGDQVFSLGGDRRVTVRPEDADGVLLGPTGEGFGRDLAVLAGDAGDGLAVGAPLRDRATITRREGGVYIFDELGEGFEDERTFSDARLIVFGEDPGGELGDRVVACGDLDGDGLTDWAASAPKDNSGQTLAGLSILGLSTQLPASGSVSARSLPFFIGTTTGERSGAALRCQDDFTGDGVPDLLIGAPFADPQVGSDAFGAVYIVDASAPVSGPLFETAALVLYGESEDSWLGWAIDTGDINGDGIPEIAAGAPGASGATGEVLIWDGDDLITNGQTTPRFRFTGDGFGDGFGRSVRIRDLDQDGYGDVLVGAPRHNPSGDDPEAFNSGALYVYAGAEGFIGWRTVRDVDSAEVVFTADQQYLQTGQRIEIGDFDADGTPDVGLLHRTEPE